RTTLSECGARIERSLRELARLTEDTPHVEALDLARHVNRYDAYMKEKLKATGAVIVPYPTSSHEVVSRRAIERRKPLDDKGSGYRDTLIWLSMLELLKSEPTNLIFVTANHRDFAEGTSLHSDLRTDLDAIGIDPSLISLFLSLEDANQRLILP